MFHALDEGVQLRFKRKEFYEKFETEFMHLHIYTNCETQVK